MDRNSGDKMDIMYVPSLQALCAQNFIEENLKKTKESLESLLQFYELLHNICKLGIPEQDKDICGLNRTILGIKKMVRIKFPSLIEKFGVDVLIKVLGLEFTELLNKEYIETLKAKDRMNSYRTGSILEVVESESLYQKDHEGCYSLEVLIQGIKWPDDVRPDQREQYLKNETFFQLFKMSKQEFSQLAKYERIQLKKLHKLF